MIVQMTSKTICSSALGSGSYCLVIPSFQSFYAFHVSPSDTLSSRLSVLSLISYVEHIFLSICNEQVVFDLVMYVRDQIGSVRMLQIALSMIFLAGYSFAITLDGRQDVMFHVTNILAYFVNHNLLNISFVGQLFLINYQYENNTVFPNE